ncbi:MAG: BatA and WFA domain-containing protein [Bdellovibrionales bacterium]|nr:BatA and WFA domain-containing protein [Bdellovibrionales bacterium]
MPGILSTLSFAQPLAFAGALLIPLLVLAYLKKRQRKTRVVSSVVILEQLAKRRVTRRRFRPPLRFFLELLALIALIGAASLPWYRDTSERVALVLDTSMSMRTRNDSLAPQPTRFAEAIETANRWLDQQSSSTRISLFQSSPRLTALGAKDLSPTAAKTVLSGADAGIGTDSLDTALTELAESGDYVRVVAITDRTVRYFGDPPRSAADDSQDTTILDAQPVGQPRPNLYLAGLRFSESLDYVGQRTVIADVGLSGSEPVVAQLELFELGEDKHVTPRSIAKGRVTAQPNSSVEAELLLPPGRSPDLLYKVELSAAEDALATNALLDDDAGWIGDGNSAENLILLVSATGGQNSLGLKRLPGAEIVVVSPREYAVLRDEELARFTLLLFHRTAPAKLPPTPALLILPPEQNPHFPVLTDAQTPRITSWAGDHPITSYLRVPLLTPSQGAIFSVPPWAQSVVNAEPGCVLAAGETQGVRYAAVGFELLPFEGAKTPVTSILTLNLIAWLSGGGELTQNSLNAGGIRLEGGRRWVIRTPAHETVEVEVPAGKTEIFQAGAPGPYRLAGFAHGTPGKEQVRKVVTVNNFAPEESSTFVPMELSLPHMVEHGRLPSAGENPLWGYLLAVALLLLVGEYLWFLLRPVPEALGV